VAESAVDLGPERRVFDGSEMGRVRAAPLKIVVKTDMAVRPEHGVEWRRLAKLNKEALHGREWRLVEIGTELKRIRECAGVPQHVVEEAEFLVKRHLNAVKGFPPEAVAAAVLWVATKALREPRPLEDFLVCCKTEKRMVRRAAWRLSEATKPRRMPIEDYVKILAARVGLSASVVKRAVEILEKKRRLLSGKNPWVWAAAALWVASPKSYVLFQSALADAAGIYIESLEMAAKKLRA
jgi:transcription initiation factor TFIIIB Brf1 subunit/transcription initiation factor TFIIB